MFFLKGADTSFYPLVLGKKVNIGGKGTFWYVNMCKDILKLKMTFIRSEQL